MSRFNTKIAASALAVLLVVVIAYGARAQDTAAEQRIAAALDRLVRVQVVGHQLAYEQQNLVRVTHELQTARAIVAQPLAPRPTADYLAKVEAEHPRLAAQQRAVFEQKDSEIRGAQTKIASLERDLTAIRERIETHLQTLQRIEKAE